ncbi:accessory Sec system protein Asp1 [Eupransor demetentiae]|uniref:Accessory Sec system protein Asp1 n=1 Tax=Eupransor demetentiae TaxID=3109584 RepID=A0ABP0ESM9_9LACO|nr:hypothetical protein R54876_GBNLAHCA_00743 [Lactobacillaceae bacterium LMG 33000]
MTLNIMPDWQRYLNEVPQMDPSVYQARLFLVKKYPVRLILRDYLPKMRALLVANQLTDVSYWSAFDYLQHVNIQEQQPLAVNDFTWPAGAEFVRMYDRVVVMVDRAQFATLWPTYPDATMYDRVDLFENGQLKQQLTLDDRGFVSRILNFEGQALQRIDYLTPSGDVAAQEDCTTGRVTTQQQWTDQRSFANMTELINEIVHRYLATLPADDVVIASQTRRNVAALADVQLAARLIMSNEATHAEATIDLPAAAQETVFSRPSDLKKFKERYGDSKPATWIAPYVTNPDTKRTATRDVLPIYWRIDDLSLPLQKAAMERFMQLAEFNTRISVVISGKGDFSALRQLLNDKLALMADEDEKNQSKRDVFAAQFEFKGYLSEKQYLDYFNSGYLLVDLDLHPNTFLQALALTKGMPQINTVKTPYVEDGQNGKIIRDTAQLMIALNKYVDDSQIWFSAQQAATNQAYKFDHQALWDRWQAVFNENTKDDGAA